MFLIIPLNQQINKKIVPQDEKLITPKKGVRMKIKSYTVIIRRDLLPNRLVIVISTNAGLVMPVESC